MNADFLSSKSIIMGLLIILFAVGSFGRTAAAAAVDGTTGTPLGGFGAGAVKYSAHNGTFAIMTQAPADAYDYQRMSNTKLQFFSRRDGKVETVDQMKAVLVDGRYDDDAIWPLHLVNFGEVNGIQVNLQAFSPLDNVNYDNMSMPYAFYEVSLTNVGLSPAEAAFAFQVGGASSAKYVANKGLNSPRFAVYASSSKANAVISVGNDQGFFTHGQCDNNPQGLQNRVAVKLELQANETQTIQFVLAWYDNSDPERYHYLGLYDNPGDIAERGLANFALLQANATELVTRMRASNLPAWLQNQTLNTLVNLSNNSMYKKDGRVAFAEGQWTCFGTMDQMWHARQIVNQLTPYYAWQELHYWARTQKSTGQIHHDFNDYNSGSANNKAALSTLMAWDDAEHADYRNIDKWVDLNCGFIISIYETFKATNDQEQLDLLWPYMKKAGQRIFDQVKQYGNYGYPYTFNDSQNSYDAGGDANVYNASLSAVAYKIMAILGEKMQEPDIVAEYTKAYETVVDSFRRRYLNDDFDFARISEGYFAGQWLAMHLRLGEIWTAEDTDYVLSRLDDYYHPNSWGMGTLKGTYNEWTPYMLSHYGGLLLQTKRADQWYTMQYDAYQRQYNDRNRVFNHPLDILPAVREPNYVATDISGGKQYISMPSLWRNYYDLVGFYRDEQTREIWVQPIILEEMNHNLTDGMFITPSGYGAISCTESGLYNQNKNITITTDHPMAVTKIHLDDNFGDQVAVTIDGVAYDFERIGTGYAKELVIKWDGILDSEGINIIATGDPGTALPEAPAPYLFPPDTEVKEFVNAYTDIHAETATELAGIDVVAPVGEVWYVTNTHNFDYLKVDNVEFDTVGSKAIQVTFRSQQGGIIEVVLDNVGGDIIGTCEIPVTGSSSDWTTMTFPIDKVTGKHNVILRFAGTSNESLMDIDKFKFLPDDGRLDRTGWTARASNNASHTTAFLDDDPETRWHGSYQEVGKWIELDMKADQTFNLVKLSNELSPNDLPRGFEVYLATEASYPNFGEPVATGRFPVGTGIGDIAFDTPQKARYIKILLTQNEPQFYFSLHELYVFFD